MTRARKALDAVRLELGAVENALVDDLLAGRIDRRAFLRHASRLGVGLPLLSVLAAATAFALKGSVKVVPSYHAFHWSM